MTISDARAGLADVVDQVRITGEPVYLTRRNKPVAALVDIVYLDALLEGQRVEVDIEFDSEAEHRRRMDEWRTRFEPFKDWFKDIPYPESASDLYASREIDPGELA